MKHRHKTNQDTFVLWKGSYDDAKDYFETDSNKRGMYLRQKVAPYNEASMEIEDFDCLEIPTVAFDILSKHPLHFLLGWFCSSSKNGLLVDPRKLVTPSQFLNVISVKIMAKVIFSFYKSGKDSLHLFYLT